MSKFIANLVSEIAVYKYGTTWTNIRVYYKFIHDSLGITHFHIYKSYEFPFYVSERAKVSVYFKFRKLIFSTKIWHYFDKC